MLFRSSNFAVLPANGWNHFCGKSKSEEEEDAAMVDVAEPKPGDIAISVNTFNIVGFFFPESNLPGPIFDIFVRFKIQ